VGFLPTSPSEISPLSPLFAMSASVPRKCFSSDAIRSSTLQAGCQVSVGRLPRKQKIGVEKWILQRQELFLLQNVCTAEICVAEEIQRNRFILLFTLLQGCIFH